MHCTVLIAESQKESVWDYPLRPHVATLRAHVEVFFNGVLIARTEKPKRVVQNGHPPVYYFAPEDVKMKYLTPSSLMKYCPWKGLAQFVRLDVAGKKRMIAAWFFTRPKPAYRELENFFAFYASMVDACFVDGVRVCAEPYSLHGGWITPNITGAVYSTEE